MNENEKHRFLEDWRRDLEEAVADFSSANKGARERWVCTEFLSNLGLNFHADEIAVARDEPPDVIFRDAHFEVKEIQDPGRRRHDEYKKALAKLKAATNLAEVLKLKHYTGENATPAQIGNLISSESGELASKKYVEDRFRASLDLLFYVNRKLLRLSPDDGPMPDAEAFAPFGFRSISALIGRHALVFWASSAAPDFLRQKLGTITSRRAE